jgi:hypothetical protein
MNIFIQICQYQNKFIFSLQLLIRRLKKKFFGANINIFPDLKW